MICLYVSLSYFLSSWFEIQQVALNHRESYRYLLLNQTKSFKMISTILDEISKSKRYFMDRICPLRFTLPSSFYSILIFIL